MKAVKIILTIIILQLSTSSYSQTIKRYQSDYSMKVTIDKDESADGGSLDDIMRANISIAHNISNSTIEIKLSDHDKRIYFFKDVKYNQTFTNNGNKYVAYTANKEESPYFISFGKDLIKIDDRIKYKSIAFHLKK
jgi:hypothetical protein